MVDINQTDYADFVLTVRYNKRFVSDEQLASITAIMKRAAGTVIAKGAMIAHPEALEVTATQWDPIQCVDKPMDLED